jgi:hypothetical protein
MTSRAVHRTNSAIRSQIPCIDPKTTSVLYNVYTSVHSLSAKCDFHKLVVVERALDLAGQQAFKATMLLLL